MLNIKSLAAIVVLATLVYRYIIYPLFLSPLSRIPSSHWTAPFSPLWILYVRHSRRENRTIYAAHVKYGPIVRLGPNEISVNCVDHGIRSIYAGGFEKHAFYPNLFPNYGNVPNMFSTVEGKPHSVRKRMISNVYSKSYLQSSRTMAGVSLAIVRRRLLPRIYSAAEEGENVNVFRFFNAVTMDFVTCYQFGLRNGANFIQDEGMADRWFEDYQSRKKFVFWPQEVPTFTDLMAKLGIQLSPKWVPEANKRLEAWCMARCDAADASATELDEESHPEDIPVVYRQLKIALATECNKSPLPTSMTPATEAQQRLSRASEMLDQLSAGQETSAITLTYLFHELCIDQSLQDALRAELLSNVPGLRISTDENEALPPAKVIDTLPLLNAIVTETLRRHAAIPGPQPRITPHVKGGISLAGYNNIPDGVRVSSMPYALHRNTDVFPDPEKFDPYRWFNGNTAEMNRWFWPFSSGGRMCIGSHLAVQQMKLITACLVVNFVVSVAEGGDEGIEQEDEYTAPPKGLKLVLKFENI